MAITVPVVNTALSVSTFGKPVADQLNTMALTAWTNAVYANGWTTQTGMGALQYRKDFPDLVRMRGVIMGGTLGQPCTTLPAGFRPPSEVYYTGGCWNGSTWVIARTVLTPTGTVTPTNGLAGANVYWQIDVTFSITP